MLRAFCLFSASDPLKKENPIDKLPNEMWKNIFDYLTDDEKIVAMYVCKNWFNFLYQHYNKDIKEAVRLYHGHSTDDKEHDHNLTARTKYYSRNYCKYYPIRFKHVLRDTFIFTPTLSFIVNLFTLRAAIPLIKEKSSLRKYVLFLMLQGSMFGTLIFCVALKDYLDNLPHYKEFLEGKEASLRLGVMNQIKIYLDGLAETLNREDKELHSKNYGISFRDNH